VNEEYMNDFYQYHDKTSQTEVFSTVISFFIKATVVGFVLYMAAKNAEKPSKTHNNQKKRDRHD
jgi:large-conductance mechanosensitive channel